MKAIAPLLFGLASLSWNPSEDPEQMLAKDPAALPSPEFTVAFTGDQGMSDASRAVLRLIKDEGTDLLVIGGDFDYKNDPEGWGRMMDEEVGDMPVLAVIGNHDLLRWSAYQDILEDRLKRMPKAQCTGEVGMYHKCMYEGVLFVFSGIGTRGAGHEVFLQKSLSDTKAAFKVCVWHKNQQKLQAGGKRDEVGWPAYEICRNHGAMIANAHEHSYSRTHMLSSYRMQTVVDADSDMTLKPGQSLTFVSGLGGKSIREQKIFGDWFGRVYTANQNALDGALFCTFNIDGNPRKALCQFKNTAKQIVDEFVLRTEVDQN